MKILCDVCEKDEASFFCVADEASLCAACDHRVHHANKLAGKHQRFSLHHPSPKQGPLCDICQEKRAFLFCQQDRAILCKDCDIPIHKANEHTRKHTRFLLTGVKLSATPTLYSEPPSSAESASSSLAKNSSSDAVSHNKPGPTAPAKSTTPQSTTVAATSTSSISEYLMEMLPGWHVEDFLDSTSPSPSGFCKSVENDDLLPFWDGDFQKNMSVLPTENMGFWVPQVPSAPVQEMQNQRIDLDFGLPNGYREISSNNNIKSSRKRIDDNSFAVPQITPSFTAIKRSRTFW